MCGKKGESVNHLTSEYSKLAKREFKRRHDNVALLGFSNCVERQNLSGPISGISTPQERVVENEGFNVVWDFNVQCNMMVEARRPYIVFVDKQAMEAKIIDIVIGALVAISAMFDKHVEKLGTTIRLQVV